jgi:hypothetical protein
MSVIKLFDIENNAVVPTEHCYTIQYLRDIMDYYPEEYLKVFSYLFYMACPNPDMNPFFNLPEDDKEESILAAINAEFSTEDDPIRLALSKVKLLYETTTYRQYIGFKKMLDKLAKYMETAPIESGRDGNISSLIQAAKNFDQIRQSFKGVEKDHLEEMKTQVRGGQRLAYDQ